MLESLNFLQRKYPLQYIKPLNMLTIAVGVGMFLYIFKPFGFINYEQNKVIASLGFSVITFISLVFMNHNKKRLAARLPKWTIAWEIIFLSFVIIVISTGNYLYLSMLINDFNLSISNYVYTIMLTFLIGLFPISFITAFRYNRFVNNNLGDLIHDGKKEKISKENSFIEFQSLNKTDEDIKIPKKNLLFVESVKNNIHIYFYRGDEVDCTIIRNTLKNIESQVEDTDLFRCHRSFIVNTKNIKNAKGNSNSYKIFFENYNPFVPVSRSYTKTFQELFY